MEIRQAIEQYHSALDEPAPFDLRVTTTFRRTSDEWTLVSRHADPLMTSHRDGPIRPST